MSPAPIPLVVAVPQVFLAGWLTRLAFPDPGWWPCALVGVALWLVAITGCSHRSAGALGLVYGLAFFIPLLSWSGVYVGAFPWLALATLQALYLAGLSAALPRLVPRGGWPLGRAVRGTVVVAAAWTLQEALRDRTPFGGFPWGRLAFSQAQSPIGRLAAWGGAPLVTFMVAWGAAALAWLVLVLLNGRSSERKVGAPVAAGVLALCLLVGFLVQLPSHGQMVRIAAVQGNVARPGLDFNAERREVLDNHAKATVALAARVAAGQVRRPDLVLWPENASDLDPYQQADARRVIDGAVDAVGVPVLVGAVLDRADGRVTNASIVWTPASGPGQRYAKRHPVPFGEYIPYRSFFRMFSSKVDLVRRDFAPGGPPGVLQVGPARVGVSICFEVAYDDLVRDTVRGGADLLVVQTNNATFGRTDEAVQQLAMSRLRAMEHGRAVAHVSTVGVSALMLPNGQVLQRSALLTADVLTADLPLRTDITLADRLGGWVELLLCALALLGVGTAVRLPWRRRRAGEIGSAAATHERAPSTSQNAEAT